jgi:predicted dinucleotide-binding enzyme
MRIGILGSGLMGGKLGTLFARAGHDVVFSYSHKRSKLEALAREAGRTAWAGTPLEAAQDAEVVLVAVHWSRLDDVLKQAGDLSGKVVVTCSLPMNDDDTGLVVANTSSGAEALAKKVASARVVSAFGTVPSEVLFAVFEKRDGGTRPSLVYCGDDDDAKKTAAQLIRDIGFEPVDAGPLQIARYSEPFTLLIAKLAYEGESGPALAYRFEHFEERSRRKQYRRHRSPVAMTIGWRSPRSHASRAGDVGLALANDQHDDHHHRERQQPRARGERRGNAVRQ